VSVVHISPQPSIVVVAMLSERLKPLTVVAGEENLCPNQTMTFNAPYRRGEGKGSISRGGFAKYWRGPSRFAIPVPQGLDPALAAPMMCGGVTVYSPLARFGAGTTAKKVGVIGVGGLGHFGIMFAKAMGAEVTAISRGDGKKDDAVTMGASKYIATGSNLRENFKGHERSLDLIICTISESPIPSKPDWHHGAD
jgi:alcohol dehydrogenase (NADP+)